MMHIRRASLRAIRSPAQAIAGSVAPAAAQRVDPAAALVDNPWSFVLSVLPVPISL
jgi:hypothetical protein